MVNKRRLVLGALFFALMFFYFGVRCYFLFIHVGSYDGWTGQGTLREGVRVTGTDPHGPATALHKDDEILALNGIAMAVDPEIFAFADRVPPGTAYRMTIRRAGQEMTVSLITVEFPPDKRTSVFTGTRFYDVLIYLIFLATALIIFLLKPDNKQVWLLALVLGTFTALNAWAMPTVVLGRWVEITVSVAKLLGLWFLPLTVHFFLIFPARLPILRRWPRLEFYLYLPLCIFVLPFFGGGRLPAIWSRQFFNLPPIYWLIEHSFFYLPHWVVIGYMVAALICLLIGYRIADQDARRRLRVVVFGSGVGFILFLFLVSSEFLNLANRLPDVNHWVQIAALIAMPFVPVSFAYAIIRHKVIPVSLMIRRSVRYVLVSRGSVLIEIVVVVLAVTAVLTYIFSRFRPSGIVIGTVSAGVAIFVWKLETRLHEKYLAPIIDRKFFRESYNSHQIIADLTDSLRSTTSLPQLCEEVATKIQSALQTENVIVLLRNEDTGDYTSNYSCEFDSEDGRAVTCRQAFRLSGNSMAIAELKVTGQPLEIEEPSVAGLREMKSALLLPLMTKQGMPGIVSLGARMGDLPFSREDKTLLMSVAAPTTFAIENSRLVERMIEEARRREEIEAENEQRAKELEEARQLQISMLPKTIPQLPHLEIAAYMKTATEVGGDYYDFHLAASGELTIVVGDATGHGLKAGTVVTATKSLFNHLAETPDVTEFFSHSSLALKRMNMRSLFMAMTVARVSGHTLTVSSAGMPPVLIYRAATGEVEEVQLTGVPLGSVTSYRYRQQQLPIASGDVIVLMSDGLPERFNPASEMLGYDQPKVALAESATLSAQAIIERMNRDAEVWAEGRPLDDDVTFVVLKVR